MKPQFPRLLRSFEFAGRGVRYLFQNEPNARIHATLAIVAVVLALLLDFSAPEWAMLALTIGTVLVAEAFNTAIETLADRVHPEHHPQIAIAKDIAAGAVAMTAITAVIVALFLYLPKLLLFLH